MAQQYLIFESSTNKIAINLDYVLEVIRMPEWTTFPNTDEFVKGIFNLRNNIIPLIDFRKYMGNMSLADEMVALLRQREQDHINWVNELISCVDEHREFTLTTDHTKCKFGLWYYSFQTNNLKLKDFLELFEKPHKEIHRIGIKVKELLKEERFDEAKAISLSTRDNELKVMINLFKELYELLQTTVREFVVIINTDTGIKSVTVDKIDRIIMVQDEEISKLESAQLGGTCDEVIKRDEELILKLDLQKLLSDI